MVDQVTILQCVKDFTAAKTFEALETGEIKKCQYKSGCMFKHETRGISCLQDILNILKDLQYDSSRFIIRGSPSDHISEYDVRRSNGNMPTYLSCPRRWVMLDIDDMPYSAALNIQSDAQEIILALKAGLPEEFQKAKCVYKFSSSQNVPSEVGGNVQAVARAHLWFWLDQYVEDRQWKEYFKSYYPAKDRKVDIALFNPVQAHYTANPIFVNMADPLTERIGQC